MKKFYILILLILFIFNLVSSSFAFTVLHTSDIHGNIFPSKNNNGGLSRIVNITDKTDKNTLIVDTGDLFQGSVYNTIYKWKYTTALMKYAKYDVATFGNHEFDNGLNTLRKYLQHSNVKYISTNLQFDDKYFVKRVKPYEIFNIENQQILVLGATTSDLKDLTNVQGVKILNTYDVLNKYISEIPHDMVVLLSHCGLEEDKKIAKNVKGIDLILGGHDHIYSKTKINNTLIVHTGELGFTVDKIVCNPETHSLSQEYIYVNENTGSNKYIDKKLNKLKNKTKKFLNKKIAYTNVTLNGRKAALRTSQTNLGKLILNSMADEFNNEYDIVFLNAGGIRTDYLIKGNITVGDIYNMLPFENKPIKGTMNGKTLKKILHRGSTEGKTYLQYISKINTINDNYQYTVITIDYLYNGGDGYNDLSNLKIEKSSQKELKEVLKQYLIKHPVLNEI